MPKPSQCLGINHVLPLELFVEIIRLATDNPVRDLDSLVSWTPFETSYAASAREECKTALDTKCALGLASKLFRALSTEFLYEDIWIRHGSDGLLQALERSKIDDNLHGGLGFGRFVKRASLCIMGSRDSGKACGLILENTYGILSSCPNIQIINRPPQEYISEEEEFLDSIPHFDDLDLPSLRRADWHNTPNDRSFARTPATSVLFFSSSLRVLILGPDNFPTRKGEENEMQRTIIDLPNLHTLGIQALNTFGESPRMYSINLPSLRRLILKRPAAVYELFDGALTSLCRQIRTIEVAHDFRFLRQEFISTILTYCTNVEELYIPVFATRAAHPNGVPRAFLEFPTVQSVYLHVGLPYGYVYGDLAWWKMVDDHFEGLCGEMTRFAGLERVVLVGREWMETVQDERFGPALDVVRRRRVQLISDDADVQRTLDYRL